MTWYAAGTGAAWVAANVAGFLAFRRALMDPARTQDATLAAYLRANADTAFGRRHGFATIRTVAEYQRRVPIASYTGFARDIDRVARGEPGVLTGEPVRRIALSSGSVSAAKRLPCTRRLQREFRRAIAPWIVDVYRRYPRAALGRAYWSVTPVGESIPGMASGVPVGFEEDSEYVGGLARRLVDATLAVPGAVRFIRDIEAFRYVTLLALLRHRDLSLISVWHPSFLMLLLDALPRFWPRLLDDLGRGGARPPGDLPADIAEMLPFAAERRRAAELARLAPEDVGRIWPQLDIISCWADGHAALAADALQRRVPDVTIQPKGLLATEGVVTIPFAERTPIAIRSHVFEFLHEGRAWLVHELEPGRVYTVVLTTGGGLYRYRLDDRVEVDGFVGRTPSLRFLGKSDQVSDLCGEKLNETFVATVLARACQEAGVTPRYAFVAPDSGASPSRYVLFLDGDADGSPAFSARVDELLAENPHYHYCRSLGQLGRLEVVRVPGLYARYAERCRAAGQRLGDIKPLALSTLGEWREILEGRSAPAAGERSPDLVLR